MPKQLNPGYRVVYGETRPAWEQILPTLKEARAFAKKHKSFGDIVFSIRKVVPGEPAQSMMALFAAEEGQTAKLTKQLEAKHDSYMAKFMAKART